MGKNLGWWEFSEAFFVWVVCRERFFFYYCMEMAQFSRVTGVR